MTKSTPKRFRDYIIWEKVPQICIGTYVLWFVGIWLILVISTDIDTSQRLGMIALLAAGVLTLSIVIVVLSIIIDMNTKKPIQPRERVEK